MYSGDRMTVTFNHVIADINTALGTETDIFVTVPAGALTGDVRVCIASDNCSNPFPFGITHGPAFNSLSSIAYEKGTGSLWVGDRGTGGIADRVYEIDSTGTSTERGALNEPYIAHPSPADGTGRIYYCNGLQSAGNQGTIEYINSPDNVETFFRSAMDIDNPIPIVCRGLATRDAANTEVYLLDKSGTGNGGIPQVLRVPIAGVSTQVATGFDFNDPAGARFDSAGNLYVTSTTQIYRVPPGGGAQLVASGFIAAAGLDLVEDGGEILLAVADQAAGEVWLVNAATGVRARVAAGLSAPVGVAFADDPAAGKTGLYVAEPTRVLRLPDPRLESLRDDDQKVLLSKAWSFDVYPSTDQTTDSQITVRFRLSPLIDPTGRSAYFRLVDPKDPSPYLPSSADGDNLPVSPAGNVTAQATLDASGVAVATLTVDDDYSGNNYRVEASLTGGASFRVLATSPVYTTWRRVYVEHDFMWRAGAFVTADSGAGQPNPMRVFVSPAGFIVGESVQILSGASFETASGEYGTVDALGASYVDVDTDPGPGQAGLQWLYPGPANPPTDMTPFSFLARVGPGQYGVAPDSALLASTFDDAFAEWRVLPTSGFVPSWPQVPTIELGAGDFINNRSPLFFNARRDPSAPFSLNTVHVVLAAQDDAPTLLGLTQFDNGLDWTWIFDGRIAALYPDPFTFATVHEGVMAHELAHQYNVNTASGGHDSEEAWTSPGAPCLMVNPHDFTNGIFRMHSPLGAPTNDLMCIRTHVDALNDNNSCSQP
jgi:hypothetical protein